MSTSVIASRPSIILPLWAHGNLLLKPEELLMHLEDGTRTNLAAGGVVEIDGDRYDYLSPPYKKIWGVGDEFPLYSLATSVRVSVLSEGSLIDITAADRLDALDQTVASALDHAAQAGGYMTTGTYRADELFDCEVGQIHNILIRDALETCAAEVIREGVGESMITLLRSIARLDTCFERMAAAWTAVSLTDVVNNVAGFRTYDFGISPKQSPQLYRAAAMAVDRVTLEGYCYGRGSDRPTWKTFDRIPCTSGNFIRSSATQYIATYNAAVEHLHGTVEEYEAELRTFLDLQAASPDLFPLSSEVEGLPDTLSAIFAVNIRSGGLPAGRCEIISAPLPEHRLLGDRERLRTTSMIIGGEKAYSWVYENLNIKVMTFRHDDLLMLIPMLPDIEVREVAFPGNPLIFNPLTGNPFAGGVSFSSFSAGTDIDVHGTPVTPPILPTVHKLQFPLFGESLGTWLDNCEGAIADLIAFSRDPLVQRRDVLREVVTVTFDSTAAIGQYNRLQAIAAAFGGQLSDLKVKAGNLVCTYSGPTTVEVHRAGRALLVNTELGVTSMASDGTTYPYRFVKAILAAMVGNF